MAALAAKNLRKPVPNAIIPSAVSQAHPPLGHSTPIRRGAESQVSFQVRRRRIVGPYQGYIMFQN